MTKTRWTPELDSRLMRLHGSMSRQELAKALGVSDGAVRARITRLGIGAKNGWSEAELAILERAYQGAGETGVVDLSALAETLGRHKTNVCRKARQMGLPTNQKRYKCAASESRGGKRPSNAKYATESERSAAQSELMKRRHAESGHPMLGKKHSPEARARISNKGKERWEKMSEDERDAAIEKMAKAAALSKKPRRQRERASWKAGWREIGGKKNYYRSRWEANYARYLEWLRRRGEIKDWKHEPEVFWFDAIKRGVRSYKPDFRVWENDGSSRLHEVKGWMDSRSRTTLRRMAKYHPEQEIVLIDSKAYKKIGDTFGGLVPGWEKS